MRTINKAVLAAVVVLSAVGIYFCHPMTVAFADAGTSKQSGQPFTVKISNIQRIVEKDGITYITWVNPSTKQVSSLHIEGAVIRYRSRDHQIKTFLDVQAGESCYMEFSQDPSTYDYTSTERVVASAGVLHISDIAMIEVQK
jgi:hypothetical protein